MRQFMALAAGFSLVISVSAVAQTATRSVSTSGSEAQSIVYAGGGSSSSVPSITPSPTAPTFMLSSPCMGVMSGSGTSPTIGISLGMSYTDHECESRANASALYAMGYPQVALQIMCQIPSVRKAAVDARLPCDKAVVEPAAVHVGDAQISLAANADPYGHRAFCKTLNWQNPADRPYLETSCKPH
jgi:hypothetical protein